MSVNQNVRLDESRMKTEPPVDENISHWGPKIQKSDVGDSHQEDALAETSTAQN